MERHHTSAASHGSPRPDGHHCIADACCLGSKGQCHPSHLDEYCDGVTYLLDTVGEVVVGQEIGGSYHARSAESYAQARQKILQAWVVVSYQGPLRMAWLESRLSFRHTCRTSPFRQKDHQIGCCGDRCASVGSDKSDTAAGAESSPLPQPFSNALSPRAASSATSHQ